VPNASDPTELHGWKENAVDSEYRRLQHRVGYRTTLAEKREMPAWRVLLCQCSAIADAVLEPKMLVINRILFPAMQFGRIAGVEALCFASFHLCQQMKGGRLPDEIRRAAATSDNPPRRALALRENLLNGPSPREKKELKWKH